MKISFFGAAREVTGSCYLVEAGRNRILVDCGMFQGSAFSEAKNFQEFGFDPRAIDAVVVTHAHLDHVGRLPKLVKEKFKGRIYLTPPTAKIAHLVLDDAEQIMQDEWRREARPMLYSKDDVENVVRQFVPVDYDRTVRLPGVSFRFRDAGHIFGSSFIEITETGGPRAVFSGDLGNRNVPILKPTAQMANADAVIVESTYGNRLHEDESTRTTRLKEAVVKTVMQRGVLVIPAFAIERTQQLLYELNAMVNRAEIPPVDMFLDSPMAIAVTDVIKEYPRYYDAEALHHVSHGDDLFSFPGLTLCKTRDESKVINEISPPKVIIAGAGMMNGGRIQHHLVRYLGKPSTTVLIIGYQASGTLGRRLYSGEKTVDVLGERVHVKAKIVSIGAYSAHADQQKLVEWISAAPKPPERVFCTHGEEAAAAALASRVHEELGVRSDVPRFGETITV
ncbi:MBL fold metallo-hydrolase [Candidatus Uhrbacteria bacterium]|nr:MBL fold metallo-hydrolase [Candidatus Uhrbacteria bacterium]